MSYSATATAVPAADAAAALLEATVPDDQRAAFDLVVDAVGGLLDGDVLGDDVGLVTVTVNGHAVTGPGQRGQFSISCQPA